jgi:hypothetical protein
LFILINSITTGGNITITGTSVSEVTAVPVAGDTEVITVDTTSNQYYQSDKKWLEVTNIDVSALTSPNYDVGVVGYIDIGNRDFTLLGSRAEFKTSGTTADIRFRVRKVQDDGAKKMSLVAMEDIGFDSTIGNGQYYDNIRTGGQDRSYTMGVSLSASDMMIVFKQGDYSIYFTNNENYIECSGKAEGIIIDFLGEPTGGISSIDHGTITLYYVLGEE